ncbi:MAG: hypothetical protein RLZZ156_858 [Deinococcota bacterium]|jgi:DNA-binding transcriptional MerR regulator
MLETKPKTLMSISEFSQQSRLSKKALRLYDALGLLEPSHVDPQSHYRYYQAGQLDRAERIVFLRQLEMPLQNIAEVLDLDNIQAVLAIRAYWSKVSTLHKDKRNLVAYLEQKLVGQRRNMFEVKTRHVPQTKIAVIAKVAFQPEMDAFIPASMQRLQTELQSQNAVISGAPFVVYHGHMTDDSDALVEVCQPYTGTLEPKEGIFIRLEPSYQEAYVTLSKPWIIYPDIMQGYDAVAAWMKANNITCTLSPREIYFADWNQISDTEPAFDIAYPY